MKTEELRKLFDKNASMLYDHSIDEYVLDFDTFQRLVEEIELNTLQDFKRWYNETYMYFEIDTCDIEFYLTETKNK